MDTYYEGRAMYLGPSSPMDGMEHGKHYEVRMQKMKSGRHRVTVMSGYSRGRRYVYDDIEECKAVFRIRPLRKGEKDEQR